MIDPLSIGLTVAPFGAKKLREYLKRDFVRNLNGLVRADLAADESLAPGIRDRLQDEWELLRRDPHAAALISRMLDTGAPDVVETLSSRFEALLSDLDMPLPVQDASLRLTGAVVDNLAAAQPTDRAAQHLDAQVTHAKLDELAEQQAQMAAGIERVSAVSPTPARAILTLPGDLQDEQARLLAELRDDDASAAANLGALVSARGLEGLDELVAVPPGWALQARPGLWRCVGRLALLGGRFSTAKAAFVKEADAPDVTDRVAALVAAARAANAGDDHQVAEEFRVQAKLLDDQHPGVLLERAERAEDPEEQLRLAESAVPRTAREHAWRESQRAMSFLRLGRFPEALDAAAESIRHDQFGPGKETEALATIFRGASELPEHASDDRPVLAASELLVELAGKARGQDRLAAAGSTASCAALGFAAVGEVSRAIGLIDEAIATPAELDDEYAQVNFAEAALLIGEPGKALRALRTESGSEGARLQRATARVLAQVDVLSAIADLDELATSKDAAVAHNARIARLIAAQEPDVSIDESVVEGLPDGDRLLAQTRALRAAQQGDTPAGLREVERYDDPMSLALRAQFAEELEDLDGAIRMTEVLAQRRSSPVAVLHLAELRAKNGDWATARDEALALATDERRAPSLRRRGFETAARVVLNAEAYADVEEIARRWRAFDADDTDAHWVHVYALARQRRYDESLEVVDTVGLQALSAQQANLLADVLSHAQLDASRALDGLAQLSDEHGRTEPLEFALIAKALTTPTELRPRDGRLHERIAEAFSSFPERFPDSQLLWSYKIDLNDPVGSLTAALQAHGVDHAAREKALNEAHLGVQNGGTPVAAIAALAGKPTVEILARNGPLPLGFPDEDVRQGELDAATQALENGGASWDPTALAVVGGLPERVGDQFVAALPGSVIGQAVFDEVGRGLDRPAGAEVATARLTADDQLVVQASDPAARETAQIAIDSAARMADRPLIAGDATRPEDGDLAELITREDGAPPFRALVSATLAARHNGMPLFSDDRVARQLARSVGVPEPGRV
jgi:hypothetical protein